MTHEAGAVSGNTLYEVSPARKPLHKHIFKGKTPGRMLLQQTQALSAHCYRYQKTALNFLAIVTYRSIAFWLP